MSQSDKTAPAVTKGDEVEMTNEGVTTPEKVSSLNQSAGRTTEEMFKGELAVLEDVDHPLVPADEPYLTRPLEEGFSDLDLISWSIADPDYATLLVGDTGTGKDMVFRTIAARTRRPYVSMNFGVGTTFEDLVGMFQPKSDADENVVQRVRALEADPSNDFSRQEAVQAVSGGSSNFEWVDGLLTWSAKFGGMFHAAEISAVTGDVTMPLHGITEEEGKRYLNLKEKGEVLVDLPVTDEEVERHGSAHAARVAKWDDDEHLGHYIHPEFRFTASMNPPSYAGSNELNAAFKQRFISVPMPYLEPEAEIKLLLHTCDAFDPDDEDDHYAVSQLVNQVVTNMRESARDGDLASPVGHRLTQQIGKLCEKMSIEQATRFILLGNCTREERTQVQKHISSTKFHRER